MSSIILFLIICPLVYGRIDNVSKGGRVKTSKIWLGSTHKHFLVERKLPSKAKKIVRYPEDETMASIILFF